ncbi:hypothetical protein LF1_23750 [Rubripirellula obstinata]|uniref:Uncharacterized protein n=1 Tax=Rubripirellula obstinata TaxID=406547 RepID=A0A5B1CF78_9BACT|nr:hypothetical protein LF1_23750 [Rubripirellula obstinata]
MSDDTNPAVINATSPAKGDAYSPLVSKLLNRVGIAPRGRGRTTRGAMPTRLNERTGFLDQISLRRCLG